MLLECADRRSLQRWKAALLRGERIEAASDFAWGPLDQWLPLVDVWRGRGTVKAAPAGSPVSVVIPALRVPVGLAAWLADPAVGEILVLANGDFPRWEHPDPRVRVLRVPWEGHGRTRQKALSQVRCEFVLFSVDDALPRGHTAGWLREGLGNFEAVYGRQLPWPGMDPVSCRRLFEWTPPGEESLPSPPHPVGGRRHDHVLALYRTETLLRFPLPEVPIAEDWQWALCHPVGYCPSARVVHAHPRHFWSLYQRSRDSHRQFCSRGFAATVPDTASLLSAIPGQLGPDWRGGLGELLGQWAAGRRALF